MKYYIQCLECGLYEESDSWDYLFDIAKTELAEGHTSISLLLK